MRTKKSNMKAQETNKPVVAPRLVKATEFAARVEAQTEAERIREQQAKERIARPIIRTPRNAVEARDVFNALFHEAA